MHKAQLFDLVMVGNIATKHPLFFFCFKPAQRREAQQGTVPSPHAFFFSFPVFMLLVLFGKLFGLMCNGMASCFIVHCSLFICLSDLSVTAAFIDRVLVHTISCSSVCHISSVDIHIYTIKCLYNTRVL